jgi:hypothetical protein
MESFRASQNDSSCSDSRWRIKQGRELEKREEVLAECWNSGPTFYLAFDTVIADPVRCNFPILRVNVICLWLHAGCCMLLMDSVYTRLGPRPTFRLGPPQVYSIVSRQFYLRQAALYFLNSFFANEASIYRELSVKCPDKFQCVCCVDLTYYEFAGSSKLE